MDLQLTTNWCCSTVRELIHQRASQSSLSLSLSRSRTRASHLHRDPAAPQHLLVRGPEGRKSPLAGLKLLVLSWLILLTAIFRAVSRNRFFSFFLWFENGFASTRSWHTGKSSILLIARYAEDHCSCQLPLTPAASQVSEPFSSGGFTEKGKQLSAMQRHPGRQKVEGHLHFVPGARQMPVLL